LQESWRLQQGWHFLGGADGDPVANAPAQYPGPEYPGPRHRGQAMTRLNPRQS
jgi:hypothetical protein